MLLLRAVFGVTWSLLWEGGGRGRVVARRQTEEVAGDGAQDHRLEAAEVAQAVGDCLAGGRDERRGRVVEVEPVEATDRAHGGAAVAVYAGGVRFYRPLHIGDLIEVEARLILTGHSSMHITVHVRGGDPRTRRLETTTHCMIVYVALDEHGDKVQVRSWNPRLPEDLELQEHAKRVIDHRSKLLRPDPPRRLS